VIFDRGLLPQLTKNICADFLVSDKGALGLGMTNPWWRGASQQCRLLALSGHGVCNEKYQLL